LALLLELAMRWKPQAATVHQASPQEREPLISLQALASMLARLALQQVPQRQSLPTAEQDSVLPGQVQAPRASPQPELELQEREQPQEAPQALQLLA
jgi:hypothetical protein